MKIFGLHFVAAIVITAASLVASAGSSFAQGGRGMFGGGGADQMLPPINSRQVEHYSKILNLNEDQRDAASALLEGYAQQAALSAKQMRDASQKARDAFRDSQDPAVWEDLGKSMTKFRDDRKKLDESFMSDLKSVATADQVAKWPSVERALRRDSTLRMGRLSGERVDLLDMVERLKFSDEVKSTVNPLLSQYEEDLDRELARRNEVYEQAIEKMMDMRRNGDMAAMQDVIEKGREAGKRVRDLNRRYYRQIADTLPEESKATFETEFKKASYPEVYRKTYANRVAESVSTFADLSSEQKEQVERIVSKYQSDSAKVNDKLAVATENMENNFNLQDMMARGWRQEGPLQDLRTERRDLDRKMQDELTKLLTEDQKARLPERNEEDEQRARRGGGGGGGGGGRNRPNLN